MKNQRKSFLVATLAALCSVLMLTAGDCSKKGETPDETPPVNQPKSYQEVSFKALDKAAVGNHVAVSHLVASKDDKNLYVAFNAGANLYRADASVTADLDDKAKWAAQNLATGLGDTVEAASLAGSTNVVRIVPAEKGALVSVTGGANAGAFYVEGATYKKAWKRDALDIANTVIAGAGLEALVTKDANGKEMPYFFSDNHLAATGVLLESAVGRQVNATTVALTEVPFFANDSDRTYAVTSAGVHTLEKAVVGTAGPGGNFAAPAANAVAAKFQVATGTANTDVSSVLFDNGKLYIGLRSAGATTGGVAIYTPGATVAAGEVKTDAVWAGKNVVGLTKRDSNGKVFAVAADGLYEVAADGKIGWKSTDGLKELTADQVTYENVGTGAVSYKNANFPTANIVAAEFVGKGKDERLVIGTTTGVIISESKDVAVPAK